MNSSESDRPPNLSQGQFDAFLAWLDSRREKAAKKYGKIRKRLIAIFRFRGAGDPQKLADRVIDRVVRKLPDIGEGNGGENPRYFSTEAGEVFREFQKGRMAPAFSMEGTGSEEQLERDRHHLETCLSRLAADERELFLSYLDRPNVMGRFVERRYRFDNGSSEEKKARHRRHLADEHGLTLDALRARVARVRLGLMNCVAALRSQQTEA